jgi:hypothetical protein
VCTLQWQSSGGAVAEQWQSSGRAVTEGGRSELVGSVRLVDCLTRSEEGPAAE